MSNYYCQHPDGCTTTIAIHKSTCRRHGSLPRPKCTERECDQWAVHGKDRCWLHGGLRVVDPPSKQELQQLVFEHGRAKTARILLTSKGQVDRWCREYGIYTGRGAPKKRCPLSRKEFWRLLVAVGLDGVARQLRTSPETVIRWRREFGLPSPRRQGQNIRPAHVAKREREQQEQAAARLAAHKRALREILAPDLFEVG